MDDVSLSILLIIAGFSFLLGIVSLLSFYRLRNIKLGFVSIAFFIFFIKAILLIFEVISQDRNSIIIDVIIILMLYFSIAKR